MNDEVEDLKRRIEKLEQRQGGCVSTLLLILVLAIAGMLLSINMTRLHYGTGIPPWPERWQPPVMNPPKAVESEERG